MDNRGSFFFSSKFFDIFRVPVCSIIDIFRFILILIILNDI